MTPPKIYHWVSSHKSHKQASQNRQVNRLWLGFGMVGVAMLSATAGALVAVALSSTPLLQTRLSVEEAKVFGQDNISATKLNFRLPELTRPVNILVLGTKVLTSDVSSPPIELRNLGYEALVNSFEGLTDVMLLLRFNPATKQLTVLSLPRDTRTYVAGVGTTKLNEANVYGGPALAARSIDELLGGIQADRYVRINVQGVEKLIDALGGVTVYVPKDMKYKDDSQHLYIDLKQGEQHLNGNQALQFLRFRYDANGDIGRVQRQQMLMRSLIEQTLNPATMARIPQILSVVQENVDTNLTLEELIALTGFASQTGRSNVNMLMLPGSFSAPGEYQASYWLPSRSRIRPLVDRYFKDGQVSEETTADTSDLSYWQIAIQDSTGDREAVRKLVRLLQQEGFSNVFVDDDWTEPLQDTRIVAQNGDATGAEAVHRALGFGEVRVESTGSLRSDITIQLGKDWLIDQPQATPNPDTPL